MKNFKKLSAMLLVIAMLFSLVTVSVYADYTTNVSVSFVVRSESGTVLTEAKAGSTVFVDAYFTPGKYDLTSATFENGVIDWAKANITPAQGMTTNVINSANKKILTLGYGSEVTIAENQLYATFKFVLPDAENPSLTLVTVTDGGATAINSDDSYVKPTFGKDVAATIKVVEGFEVASAVAVKDGAEVTNDNPIAVGLGTTLAKAVEGVTATLKDSTGTKTDTNYAITWDENANYNSGDATTVQEVTGKVTVDGSKTANATTEPVTVKAYIKIGKIALDEEGVTVDAITAKTYQKAADDAAVKSITAADVATAVNNESKTVAVKKGEYEGIANITWTAAGDAADLDLTKVTDEEGNSANIVTLTGKLTAPDDSAYFKTGATDKTVTMVVKVVPAEIKGGSISVNNPIDNGYATVSITVPASEIAKMPLDEEGDSDEVKAEKKAKRTIAISIAGTGDKSSETGVDEYVVSAEEIAAANEADAKDLTVSLKSDKKMKDLGYSSSGTNTFTVDVTVGGTKLLNGDSKDAVSGEVKKASSSSATGINKGSSTTTTYAVTVVETTNGTVTVSPEKAAKDATVTITAAPAEGYRVKTVTVTKADGTNVPVDEDALTFTMPASAVKVAVEFEEGTDEPVNPTPDGKFADVADDFWAAKDIYTLKDAGIIGGKSETEFDPNGDVTRAEFAKMVVGLFGYKATSDAVNFEDCAADEWFTPYVAAGVEAGVIKGISDTEFAPNATITREDACTILGRALNKVAESNELKFTDADKVSEYAAPYVALLSELGYVNGYEDGSFLPQNNITRAEAAKIIAGIYNAKDTTVTEDNTEAADNTEATVEGENTDADAEVDADAAAEDTTVPVEENAADATDTIDVEPEK